MPMLRLRARRSRGAFPTARGGRHAPVDRTGRVRADPIGPAPAGLTGLGPAARTGLGPEARTGSRGGRGSPDAADCYCRKKQAPRRGRLQPIFRFRNRSVAVSRAFPIAAALLALA